MGTSTAVFESTTTAIVTDHSFPTLFTMVGRSSWTDRLGSLPGDRWYQPEIESVMGPWRAA